MHIQRSLVDGLLTDTMAESVSPAQQQLQQDQKQEQDPGNETADEVSLSLAQARITFRGKYWADF